MNFTPSQRQSDGVTICIPNWNHRHYLGRSVGSAIRSAALIRARGLGCQIVIVDDFSRDGSQRLLFSLGMQDQDHVLDVVLAPENCGLGPTRNLALKHAQYRIVCFMDADNELIPENVFDFWRAMDATKATMAYGNLLVHNGTRTVHIISNDILSEELYRENYVDAFALVDADRIEELGGYYGKHAAAHEDWELLLHLIAENESVIFIPMVLGHYHVSNLSMIQTVNFERGKMHRVYNQRQTGFPPGFKNRQIYHPDLGWL